VLGATAQDARGEGAGGLDVTGVIQQNQRLLRNVRAAAFGDTFLTAGRIEGQQAGMRKAALPPGIEAAAILAGALARLIGALGEIEILPITVGLVGLHAGPADG